MKRNPPLDRRRFLTRGLAGVGALSLAGCDRLSASPGFIDFISSAEKLTQRVQRLLIGQSLAPEFREDQISKQFRANGTTNPRDKDYRALVKTQFADWKLTVDGLVEKPGQFSLAELRAMPARTQITRHDCVEGWSCIGKWKGVPLSELLQRVGVKPQARYVVLHCADTMDEGSGLEESADDGAEESSDETPSDKSADGADDSDETEDTGDRADAVETSNSTGQAASPSPAGPKYYESIDLIDAYHPQTILAYEMNDQTLPVAYGAPLRLRVERQLGYKMAKYVMRIELAENLDAFGKGKGGYWEDNGYEWYAGV